MLLALLSNRLQSSEITASYPRGLQSSTQSPTLDNPVSCNWSPITPNVKIIITLTYSPTIYFPNIFPYLYCTLEIRLRIKEDIINHWTLNDFNSWQDSKPRLNWQICQGILISWIDIQYSSWFLSTFIFIQPKTSLSWPLDLDRFRSIIKNSQFVGNQGTVTTWVPEFLAVTNISELFQFHWISCCNKFTTRTWIYIW